MREGRKSCYIKTILSGMREIDHDHVTPTVPLDGGMELIEGLDHPCRLGLGWVGWLSGPDIADRNRQRQPIRNENKVSEHDGFPCFWGLLPPIYSMPLCCASMGRLSPTSPPTTGFASYRVRKTKSNEGICSDLQTGYNGFRACFAPPQKILTHFWRFPP